MKFYSCKTHFWKVDIQNSLYSYISFWKIIFSVLFFGNNIKIESSPAKAVTTSPSSVTATWKNSTTASDSMGGIKSTNENLHTSFANQTGDNSTDSGPGGNGTSGDTTVGKTSGSQGGSWTSFSSCTLEPCPFKLPVGKRLIFVDSGRWGKILCGFMPRSSGGRII